ncbi:hypothetical protein [Tsukamurella sp. PLM1]|nr:hypothetical protein [Tsukamurella sp. PLM1]
MATAVHVVGRSWAGQAVIQLIFLVSGSWFVLPIMSRGATPMR